MALSTSPRVGNSRRDELENFSKLLAQSLREGERPKREACALVKEFLDEYYATKEKDHDLFMNNLLPINCTRRDLYADTIEVLEAKTSGEQASLHSSDSTRTYVSA